MTWCLLVAAASSGCGVDVSQVFATSDNNAAGAGQPGGGGGTGGGEGGSTPTTTGEGGGTTSGSTTSSTTSSSTTTTTTTTKPPSPVACGGNQTCEVPANICCWDKWGIGTGDDNSGECFDAPVSPFDCNTEIEQGGVQTVISCQNDSHCGVGESCCGDVVSFQTGGGAISYYPTIACRDSCTWPTRIMCKTNGATTTECPQVFVNGQNVQTVCEPSTLLPAGYLVCRPPP